MNTAPPTSSAKPRRLWPPVLLVLALCFLAAYFLPLASTRFIGQETLRGHARAALTAALERPVAVEGDVSLTMIPWLGLKAAGVKVSGRPGFGAEPLLEVESIGIGLSLTALAARTIRVDSLSLGKARLRLVRDAAGQENWSLGTDDDPPAVEAPSGWKVEALPSGVTLSDAQLILSDAQNGVELRLTRLNLATSSSRPFQFSYSCQIQVLPWDIRGELHAAGQGSYDSRGGHIYVHGSQAAGWLERPATESGPASKVTYNGKLMFHGEAGAVELSEMTVQGLGLTLKGQVNAAALYEARPYLHLDLTAEAERSGRWASLLGLNLTRPQPAPEDSAVPAIRPPDDTGRIEARAVISSTPLGWLASRLSLRDSQGRLDGQAKDIGGDVEFTFTADNLDLTPWLAVLPRPRDQSPQALKSLKGSLSATNLTLGPVEFEDAHLSASGRDGVVRLYPFTLRTHQAVTGADIRLWSKDPDTQAFSGQAHIQAIPPGSLVLASPTPVAEAAVSGETGPAGLLATVTLNAKPSPKDFKPVWLSAKTLKAWEILGGGRLTASLRLPPGQDGLWEIPEMTLQTAYTRMTGRAWGGHGRTGLDIQADSMNLERMEALAAALGDDQARPGPNLPVLEARIAAKRFHARDVEMEDVFAEASTRPGFARLSSFTGAALGGRFSGSLDLDLSQGRRLAATLNLGGVKSEMAHPFWPGMPRVTGALECKLSLEAQARPEETLWQHLKGQVELGLGQGGVTFATPAGSPQSGSASAAATSRPWPVGKAQASLRFALKPAAQHTGQHDPDKPREAALAEISGSLKVDSQGIVRSTQVDIRGQAGLEASGKPLWYRQQKLEGQHAVAPPFGQPGRTLKAAWSGRLEADLERESFTLSALELNLGGVLGKGQIAGQQGASGTQLSGSLEMPEFNPREAASRLGLNIPAGAHPEAWKRARLSLDVGGSLKEVRLTRIQAQLDETSITGQAFLTGPSTRLDLAVGTLDLDRLAPAPVHHDPNARPETPLPLAELREMNLEARVRFARLVKDKLHFENALTEFSAAGGRFSLRQSAPNFYGGPYLLDIKGDVRGQEMNAHMDLKLSSFSASSLLRELAGGTALSKGTTDFAISISTRGATDRALRRQASGTASFEVSNGLIALREAAGRPTQQTQAPGLTPRRDDPAPPPPPADGLAFTRLGASFTIREGMAVTRDFVLAGHGITAKGDGWVSLDDEKIDLNLTANVPDIGDLPVRIHGPLYDPRMEVDKSRIIPDTIINIFKGILSIPGSVIDQLRRVF